MHDNDSQVADDLGNCFNNILTEMNIVGAENNWEEYNAEYDPIITAINKFEYHPNILKIKDNIGSCESYSFFPVEEGTIIIEIYSHNESYSHSRKSTSYSFQRLHFSIPS